MIKFYLSEIASALKANLLGKDVQFTACSIDTRQIKPGAIYLALQGERFDGHDFVLEAQEKGASALIVSKKVTCSLPTLQVKDTRVALGKLAHLWRQSFDLPLIAITGSNGKTTTKEMLKSIFLQATNLNQEAILATQGNYNNDIGMPLTLFNLNASHQYAIIEMGANHPGEIAYLSEIAQPTVATITQCSPAHLAGFKTVKGVALAKGEIFANLNGTAIINHDDNYAELWRKLAKRATINSFGIQNNANVTAKNLKLFNHASQFVLHTPIGQIAIQLPLLGQHNIMNALAASSCALVSGCSLAIIKQGLEAMQPITGRLQVVPAKLGITLIDDTYNANPASLEAALSALMQYDSPRWLVLGDMGELGEDSIQFHQQAAEIARKNGVERLWAIGELTKHTVEHFGHGATHFSQYDNLTQAIKTELTTETTILIKGSRSMKLEQIVQALQQGD
ncbi:MAG: UDP-N-acetylmuramoyl-tripeptide--D-alanyl-D-alanine ligase [Thiomargarita sp.]|nr:UDP-N-acetylmuramoyl-tripeptide--D-alanyl-D-alanine ligase [Thiomargarita sp.]